MLPRLLVGLPPRSKTLSPPCVEVPRRFLPSPELPRDVLLLPTEERLFDDGELLVGLPTDERLSRPVFTLVLDDSLSVL